MKTLFLVFLSFGVVVTGILAAPPAKTKDAPVEFGIKVEPTIDLELLKKNAIVRVKEAANRAKSQNNLRQLGIAMHTYHDVYNHLPGNVVDKKGAPLLSWRVLLLPYIEEDTLFKEFKLDEPWDSKHNIKLLEKMPKVYQSPRVKTEKPGYTVYQRFFGPKTAFPDHNSQMKITSFQDGTSNTLMTFEGARAVPWTKPEDPTVDAKNGVPDQSGPYFNGTVSVGMGDGSVRTVRWKTIDKDVLRYLIDPADGMVVPNID
ncbi:MAG: DUF1559 domain-containing protein [Zavarzinella sp.]